MAKAPTEIRSRARAYSDNAIAVLVEIMNDRSAPPQARIAAAEALLNRGIGPPIDRQKFQLVEPEFYVYSIHKGGRLVYIGKGSGRRHLQSAQRLGGRSRIRADFNDEQVALAFESRLIRRFQPVFNVKHNTVSH